MKNNKIIALVLQAANNAEVELIAFEQLSESYYGMKIKGSMAHVIGSEQQFNEYEFIYQSLIKEKGQIELKELIKIQTQK
jgi:hypothetical protein